MISMAYLAFIAAEAVGLSGLMAVRMRCMCRCLCFEKDVYTQALLFHLPPPSN